MKKNKIEEVLKDILDIIWGTEPEPKRARTDKGTYKGDNPTTKEFNEAWVGGVLSMLTHGSFPSESIIVFSGPFIEDIVIPLPLN